MHNLCNVQMEKCAIILKLLISIIGSIKMEWRIKHIFNFTDEKTWKNGYGQFGFHDYEGKFYLIRNEASWFGCLTEKDEFLWTAGSTDPNLSSTHIYFDLKNPMYVSRHPKEKSIIISSGGNKKIFKFFPEDKKAEVLIDAQKHGLKDIGNCVFDKEGNIWINEITGYRIWQFDLEGKKMCVVGDGKPGFQEGTVNCENAQFNWIYDIRIGPDNNLYILDSRNYTLRMIDFDLGKVIVIAGTGKPGYSGDGGLATEATFGSDKSEKFDGPWAISLDEEGNIFIGDTHNHVVRMVEKKSEMISTIAGNSSYIPSKKNLINETNLFKINLPKICSMDYYNKELFIPEWDGDLIVLEKIN